MAGSAAEERLRALACATLRKRLPQARICHEINTAGNGSVRLDLAAVDPEHLVLVEIKSERDTLKRLDAQLAAAHAVADEVWLVVTIKHAEALQKMRRGAQTREQLVAQRDLRAQLYVTKVLIENTAGELQDFQGFYGTGKTRWCPRARFAMMWAEEMRAALRPWGMNGSMTPMTEFAVLHMTGTEIRKAQCAALRSRPFARADEPIAWT
jgi:hypothetical protein